MKRYLPSWHSLSFIILYLLMGLYTLTFPDTVTWFIMYVFTLVLLIAFLSARLRVRLEKIYWKTNGAGDVDILFQLIHRYPLLFLFSSLTLTLSDSSVSKTIHCSAFFKHAIQVRFASVPLTRGHYDHLMLEIKGYGLFGIFKHHSMHKLPVELSIYPKILTTSKLTELLEEQSIQSIKSNPVSQHEFQVKEIRQYQTRDSLSTIDWKSSLKREQWMIKEYDVEELKPFVLCFVGSPSLHFEQLLSLTYTLYQKLSASYKVTLYLIGQFDESPQIHQSAKDFLIIQPSNDQIQLKHLVNTIEINSESMLIIKPNEMNLPNHLDYTASISILTEDHLYSMKGVRTNEKIL